MTQLLEILIIILIVMVILGWIFIWLKLNEIEVSIGEVGIRTNNNILEASKLIIDGLEMLDKNLDTDLLLERHFDSKGLIDKGLAVEVTEEKDPCAKKPHWNIGDTLAYYEFCTDREGEFILGKVTNIVFDKEEDDWLYTFEDGYISDEASLLEDRTYKKN